MRQEYDMIEHPKHYKRNGFEVIDIIEAFTEGLEGIEATDTGNAIKYILRWSKKNGVEDLKKCAWYINHLINKIEGECESQKNENNTVFIGVDYADRLMRETRYNRENDINHFKCPKCGGNIVREIRTIAHSANTTEIFGIGEPECDTCGELYSINIDEDLSYRIREKCKL